MEEFEYISIEAAIEEYIDVVDLRNTRLPKDVMLKWADDQVSKLSFKNHKVHKVAMKEIHGNRVVLGDDLDTIVQVLYKEDPSSRKVKQSYVSQWVKELDNDCELKVDLDCPECAADQGFEIDVDYWVERTQPQLFLGNDRMIDYGGLQNRGKSPRSVQNDFRLMRYKQHNFFNAEYHVKNSPNLNKKLNADAVGEYWVDYPVMHTNIESGFVLISYLGNRVDEDGYNLIPNLPEVLEAIRWTIEERFSYREYKRTRDRSYLNDSEMARQKRMEAMGRAREKLKLPKWQEIQAVMENIHMKINNYYSTGNLGAYQKDTFNAHMQKYTRR